MAILHSSLEENCSLNHRWFLLTIPLDFQSRSQETVTEKGVWWENYQNSTLPLPQGLCCAPLCAWLFTVNVTVFNEAILLLPSCCRRGQVWCWASHGGTGQGLAQSFMLPRAQVGMWVQNTHCCPCHMAGACGEGWEGCCGLWALPRGTTGLWAYSSSLSARRHLVLGYGCSRLCAMAVQKAAVMDHWGLLSASPWQSIFSHMALWALAISESPFPSHFQLWGKILQPCTGNVCGFLFILIHSNSLSIHFLFTVSRTQLIP